MNPIRDCAYLQEDGCCGYPHAVTPECHAESCPRLSPDVYGVIEEMVVALKLARVQLEHDVPELCWATGPNTGDPIQDLVICPGCVAIAAIDAAIAKARAEQ